MEDKDIFSYIYSYKCQNKDCYLEFKIMSWYDDWKTKHSPFCPECGEQDTAFLCRVESPKQITEIAYNNYE